MTAKRTLTARSSAARSPELDIGSTPEQAAAAFGKAVLTETEVPYDTQREVTGADGGLAADVSSAFAELEALVFGDPKLRPGVPVALNGSAGRSRASTPSAPSGTCSPVASGTCARSR